MKLVSFNKIISELVHYHTKKLWINGVCSYNKLSESFINMRGDYNDDEKRID